jgi:hypothetical protein
MISASKCRPLNSVGRVPFHPATSLSERLIRFATLPVGRKAYLTDLYDLSDNLKSLKDDDVKVDLLRALK